MMQPHNFHLVVIQCYCNPFKLTEVIFFPLKHSFCWTLLSLPYVLSEFIFSFHLLTLGLFKVSLFSFICLVPLALASLPSNNKQVSKRLLFCIRMGVKASLTVMRNYEHESLRYHATLVFRSALLCTKQLLSRMQPAESVIPSCRYVGAVGLWVFSFLLHTLSYREMSLLLAVDHLFH